MEEKIRLTQFSPGAGCGCKIAPKDLEEILKGSSTKKIFESLMVGNETKDDAAVYDIGGGKAVVSTTDFFTPIVDDPFDFGRIAATNAISDIYAMGAKPLMAIAILGWPLDKLPAEVAGKVVSGARTVCDAANIPLAGGHSINSADPIFGLAVTGLIDSEKVKQNNMAEPGCKLFLTKPIGIGLVSSAEKFGVVNQEDKQVALELMTTLNISGEELSSVEGVKALTDVTGFGLAGHCLEMAEGSNLKAVIEYKSIPKIQGVDYYIEQECMPGGTFRNFASYGHKLDMPEEYKPLLCDPQTSGGLLIAVKEESIEAMNQVLSKYGQSAFEIGYLETFDEGERFLVVK